MLGGMGIQERLRRHGDAYTLPPPCRRACRRIALFIELIAFGLLALLYGMILHDTAPIALYVVAFLSVFLVHARAYVAAPTSAGGGLIGAMLFCAILDISVEWGVLWAFALVNLAVVPHNLRLLPRFVEPWPAPPRLKLPALDEDDRARVAQLYGDRGEVSQEHTTLSG